MAGATETPPKRARDEVSPSTVFEMPIAIHPFRGGGTVETDNSSIGSDINLELGMMRIVLSGS
jgi:hypothetical protein